MSIIDLTTSTPTLWDQKTKAEKDSIIEAFYAHRIHDLTNQLPPTDAEALAMFEDSSEDQTPIRAFSSSTYYSLPSFETPPSVFSTNTTNFLSLSIQEQAEALDGYIPPMPDMNEPEIIWERRVEDELMARAGYDPEDLDYEPSSSCSSYYSTESSCDSSDLMDIDQIAFEQDWDQSMDSHSFDFECNGCCS